MAERDGDAEEQARRARIAKERRKVLRVALWVVVVFGVVVLIGRLTAHGDTTASQPPPTTEPAWMTEHLSQSYWNCWDTGPLVPHHLGYRVLTDHLCTDQELASLGYRP